MTLSPSPNHSVIKAQGPDRRVAAETEGNDKGEDIRAESLLLTLLREMARELCAGPLLPFPEGKGTFSRAFLCNILTPPNPCEVGSEDKDKERGDQKKREEGTWEMYYFHC